MTRRTPDKTPVPERRNAQGRHDGSGHRPEEFDSQNPAKQVPRADPARTPPRRKTPDPEP
ncbi:hypothetical protein FDP22_00485 [Paroceanicella profunda]|uniref:Uncharacterized protein n=1 Tax=Paroceanicella profunda TaxID=2579971 RepID=A0A5B8FVP7_9RHOB|nr:hypothetical protein [Paroceanicella profunda]QDL90402.1 hypothetical protein FDP22_00485 [Paroceanicella profunda]